MTRKIKISVQPLTVADAFEKFVFAKRTDGIAPKTIDTYKRHFHIMSKHFDSDEFIDALTTEDIMEAVDELLDLELSPNSIRSMTATMSTFLSWARGEGLTNAKISLFKGDDRTPEIYTEEELKLLLRPPKRPTFTELRSYTIVNLLVSSGCRAGTLRSIQNRDVYLDSRIIICRHMKSRNTISIPLPERMASILREYMKTRGGDPSDPLFCTETGEKMTESALRNSINRYNKSRGVKRTGIHKFRHTFARMYLVDCGGDALKLQRLLGHQSLEMTKHYVQIFAKDLVNEVDRSNPLDVIDRKRIGRTR